MGSMVNNNTNNNEGLVNPTPNSDTKSVIQRAIEGIQRMIKPYDDGGKGEEDNETTTKAVIQINPAMKRHWESEIKILREAPRDPDKLRAILKVKQKEYEKATNREDIERLVSEIEMFKFVLFLVCRRDQV